MRMKNLLSERKTLRQIIGHLEKYHNLPYYKLIEDWKLYALNREHEKAFLLFFHNNTLHDIDDEYREE
jgi:hypothetical protein